MGAVRAWDAFPELPGRWQVSPALGFCLACCRAGGRAVATAEPPPQPTRSWARSRWPACSQAPVGVTAPPWGSLCRSGFGKELREWSDEPAGGACPGWALPGPPSPRPARAGGAPCRRPPCGRARVPASAAVCPAARPAPRAAAFPVLRVAALCNEHVLQRFGHISKLSFRTVVPIYVRYSHFN